MKSETEMALFIHSLRVHLATCNLKVALNNAEVCQLSPPLQHAAYSTVCFF